MSTYPEARAALFALIDGSEHAGRTVSAYYHLTQDFKDSLPAALLYVRRGSENYLDRTDWVAIDVFAAPGEAIPVLESIRASLVDQSHDVPGVGYIDDVQVEQTPQDVPYVDTQVMQATATFRVISRPVATWA